MNIAKKISLIAVAGVSGIVGIYYTFAKSELDKRKDSGNAQQAQSDQNNSATNANTQSKSTETVAYKDGVYQGDLISTKRGDFQLSISVEGGKIAKIDMLTYPNEGRGEEINTEALPKYTKQALDVQSSDITLISGASETYKGFKGSLQSALNKAK